MKKRLSGFLLSFVLMLVPVLHLEAADHILYASDGRTINVSSEDVEAYKKVGWYESREDAEIITMYSSDGRTLQIPGALREAHKKVGWFDTKEEADIITMYAPDGRTIEIPGALREAYKNVGWYNTEDEVTITMYAPDGRSLKVFRDDGEAYKNVGWFYNIDDVSSIMYDKDGNEQRVFRDNYKQAEKDGLVFDKKLVMQLMFSDDGRVIFVPFKDVDAYMKVGWYRGGGKVDPARPMVALTFDDGPGKYTNGVLDVFEKYGSRATFYVQGQYVSRYSNVVKRAVNMGCEIGNHTWNHVNLSNSSAGTVQSQISRTNNAVYNATGVYPKTYRPPYGACNSSVLANVNMPAIFWSVDTLDWKTRSTSKTISCVSREVRDGSIILMHDIHSPTANAVPTIVPMLLKRGYQLVTVSELLQYKKGGAVSGRKYSSGY